MNIDPSRPDGSGNAISSRLLAASVAVCFFLSFGLGGCTPGHHKSEGEGEREEEAENHSGESWAITAWGAHFEIFPEIGELVAGESAEAYVHVTRLDGFSPLSGGALELVLISAAGESSSFRTEGPLRPGIFEIDVEPAGAGDFDLLFRIEAEEVAEEIRGGRVRVGTLHETGGLLVAPAPKGGSSVGEPLSFLKEEQWRSDFGTAWVRRGAMALSIQGPARLRPPAGGEAMLASPVAGVVQGTAGWPYPGRDLKKGAALFEIAPRVDAGQSLASLEAEATGLEIEKMALGERLERLEELLELGAVSVREMEGARHHLEVLEARHKAARRDLATRRELIKSAARRSDREGALILPAPFDGSVAEVIVTPGAAVAQGEPLARLLRTDVVWLEVALSPADIRNLEPGSVHSFVWSQDRHAPLRIEKGARLVSVAPEASPATGLVAAYFEFPAGPGLVLGTAGRATVLLEEKRLGVVIPSSAVIDDGGVDTVYLQLAGERFLRQRIEVLETQGDLVLVDGLEPGQRLVERGGDAIRRSSLMSQGEAHGHVH